MCGIAGFLNTPSSIAQADGVSIAGAMADRMVHRGPDDAGIWGDFGHGVFLAHRRLSILDLSPNGHQPMLSQSTRHVLVFNGEIYNHEEIRCSLDRGSARPQWRGHSDTEVVLAAIEEWGLREALTRCVGMFALALWDRDRQELTLARDRIGEKPLYWARFGASLLFASELKGLDAHPAFRNEVDRDALSLLLRLGYVPAPYCILRNVRKVLPGTFVRIGRGLASVEESYWSARDVALRAREHPWEGSEHEAADELERLLKQAIGLQLCADVPVGAFLSGGIDSSTVVALAQTQSVKPVKTFSIGFHEKTHDEAPHAARVARHIGTDHTELYLTARDAMAVIPKLPTIYDEPFADPSQIPTFLVSQLARASVVVSLSGDGGDELFMGYDRYRVGRGLSQVFSVLPAPLRRALDSTIGMVSAARWNDILVPLLRLAPGRFRVANPGDKLLKAARLFGGVESPMELYRTLMSQWEEPARIVLGSTEPPTALTDESLVPAFKDPLERMSWIDLVTYLPDDILVKLDRASMAVSLESRVPLLDHRIVEFSCRLPTRYKFRDGIGKRVLRRVLERYVPRSLTERPKMGFGVPIGEWLRGPLREWAEALLDEGRLRNQGFLDPAPIRAVWLQHLDGKRNWQYQLWSVLSFQAWLESQEDRS